MSRRTRNILIAVIGVIALAAVISVIMGAFDDDSERNMAGEATKAEPVVISGTEVPAYEFEENVYIIAENLNSFGIAADYDKKNAEMNIHSEQSYFVTETDIQPVKLGDKIKLYYPEYKTFVEGKETAAYASEGYTLIMLDELNVYGSVNFDGSVYSCTPGVFETAAPAMAQPEQSAENTGVGEDNKIIVVLDPGHGKSSDMMSADEKEQSGWVYNDNTGGWGEWRHFKYGASSPDCEGEGCSKRVTPNGSCWYPIGDGDRDTEPEINLNNCLAAKSYLEQMGYNVRLTRSSNDENPSITRRLTYCYPDCDTSKEPDAAIFVCVHSNAGGGSGTSYIELEGPYDQPTTLGSSDAYAAAGNALGQYINDEISSATLLSENGAIGGEPELIAFCKAPVVCGYMEIGFFDNAADLEILNSSADAIGNAIAKGIDKFIREYGV